MKAKLPGWKFIFHYWENHCLEKIWTDFIDRSSSYWKELGFLFVNIIDFDFTGGKYTELLYRTTLWTSSEVTRCQSQRENDTMAKDKQWVRKLVFEKLQPCVWCCVTRKNVSEFAFGRVGVTTAHAPWLTQLECGVLIDAGGTRAFGVSARNDG